MESAESFEILTREPSPILSRNEGTGDYYLEKTHAIYYEIQLQINVVELNYCDIIFWSPKPSLDHLVIRVYADIEFWKVKMERAQKFHEQIMMPEILAKSYTRTGCSSGDENIFLDVRDPSKFMEQEISTSISTVIQHEDEEKEKDTSLTNLFIEFGDMRGRLEKNLMNDTTDEILETFLDHKDQLKRLYDEQIILLKRNYRPKDLPHMIALDIVNDQQYQAMAEFAESRLSKNSEEENNSSDVIFDVILPEWALAAFCRKFNLTRSQAIETLNMQSKAMIDNSTLD